MLNWIFVKCGFSSKIKKLRLKIYLQTYPTYNIYAMFNMSITKFLIFCWFYTINSSFLLHFCIVLPNERHDFNWKTFISESIIVFAVLHPWCFSPFDTICTILKTCKGPMGSFSTLLHECFSRFLNYTNGTKSRKVSHFLMFLRQLPFFQMLLLFVFIFRHRLMISTTPIEYYKCICIWIWIW